ncbi:MAG: RNHCP domain-containing protein [Patescibacteria group bacterium]|nr:RNHCP domain-containing protein [Patescibacteria group bacterium]
MSDNMTTSHKKFQRTKEDFTCEQCSFTVEGNGYTNHCPKCLWSKHVDVNPGDRAATCGGTMEPVGVEVGGERHSIVHVCTRCNFERKNKVSKDDDFDTILTLLGFTR